MKCETNGKTLSAYVDGALQGSERRVASDHIASCARCRWEVQRMSLIRRSLRTLPVRTTPVELTSKLQVMASRERTRRIVGPFFYWFDHVRLLMKEMMQPFAIPAAGGLVSALVIFSLLVPPFIFDRTVIAEEDVPTILYTEATVKSIGPLMNPDEDIIVELLLDDQGRIMDYSMPKSVMQNAELRRNIENNLVLTQFTPATSFGQPRSGKLRLSFRRNQIDIRG
jgi:hypothetical protein